MMKFEATIFIANKPNYNSRVYREEVLEEALADAKLFTKTYKVTLPNDSDGTKELEAFKLLDIKKEVNLFEVRYIGVFETIKSVGGDIIESMLNDNIPLAIAPIGSGTITEYKKELDDDATVQDIVSGINGVAVVETYSIENFNIIACEDFNTEYRIVAYNT